MHVLKKAACIMAVLMLTSVLSYGASSIRGFVIDKTSGEPLPVANVMVQGLSAGAATNLDGYFVIPNLTSGQYKLAVSYLGYESKVQTVDVNGSFHDPIYIELNPSAMALEVVEVTFEKEDDEANRLSARVSNVPVDGGTIRKLPSLMGEMDVMRAVQAIPGVKSSSDISSAIYVRGGSADMTLITMDQSTVYNPSHLFGLFSTFNADAVKHLNLMKGGFPAQYGGRSGSVLEVITNEGNRRKTEGLASIGIISARGALEGPLWKEKGSYAFSGRRTYMEPIIKALQNSSEDFKNIPMYYFYDGNGKINYDITPRTTLTVGGYAGHDNLSAEFGEDDSPLNLGTFWGNRTFASRLRHVLPGNSFVTFGAAYSHYKSGMNMTNTEEKRDDDGEVYEKETILLYDFKNRFNDWALRTDYEYYGWENHKLRSGVEAHRYSVEVSSRDTETEYVNIDTVTWNFAHYLSDEWRISTRFEINGGLRTYYHQDGEFWRFDPRLATVFHWDDRTRFKLAGGRYHQFIDIMSANDQFSSFDIWTPNDGSIEPSYTDQIVLGFEHDSNNNNLFTFETYYNDMSNIHMFNEDIDRGVDGHDAFRVGEGHSWGFEFMLQRKRGRLTGWVGYSLAWSERRFPNSSINNGDWYYPKWDRRHDFIAVGTYRISQRWDVSSQWRYNTGQGYTRALGMYQVDSPTYGDGIYIPDGDRTLLMGERNNYRYPADHRLDITFTYNHKFWGKDAKLNLSIYNVYSRRSLWYREYNTEENPVEVNDIKLLPILPLISYEVHF